MKGALDGSRVSTAAVTKSLATATASRTDAPFASSAVIAAANVQPAPETRSSPIFGRENTSTPSSA